MFLTENGRSLDQGVRTAQRVCLLDKLLRSKIKRTEKMFTLFQFNKQHGFCLCLTIIESLIHQIFNGHKLKSFDINQKELIPECQEGPSQYPRDLLPTSGLSSPWGCQGCKYNTVKWELLYNCQDLKIERVTIEMRENRNKTVELQESSCKSHTSLTFGKIQNIMYLQGVPKKRSFTFDRP